MSNLTGYISVTLNLENPTVGEIEHYCAQLREWGFRDVKPGLSSNNGSQVILSVSRAITTDEDDY